MSSKRGTHSSSTGAALRRTGFVACAIGLSLALVACGKKDEPAPATPGASTPQVATPAAPAAPAPVLPVSELLQKAKAAEKEQKLVTPAADNAMSYYLQIIDQEPTNPQATQALVDLFPIAASSAESAIAAKNAEEAERIIGLLDRSSPGSYTVTTLRAKLDAQRAATDRVETDRLAQEQKRLELQQQQAAAAQAAATEPAATPPAPAAPPPAEEVAEATPPASEPDATATPPPAAAAAKPPAATPPAATTGQTRDVRLVRQVPPAFPPDAVRKRVSGWVEVRFTVGPQGTVTAAEVLRAQPARMFDRAALEAVKQWKFEPALRNGQPVAAQRTQRIEFKL